MGRNPSEADWSQVSQIVADSIGLDFPRERLADLQRGLAGAADEFKFDDIAACIDWLLSASLTKKHLQVLAGHLTIGETYFFREKRTFEVLASDVLPALIDSRRSCGRSLRLWSAGCCTGEEAYSLAILLHQVLPDLANWNVTILATDINAHFIEKAEGGSYGKWSFRGVPNGFTERYFTRSDDGRYSVVPAIKKLVSFAYLNLADAVYPSLVTGASSMDVIFCRNVLMYFTQEQIGKVIGNLRNSLVDGGSLAVSPSEASQSLFSQFAAQNFPGAVLYRKSAPEVINDQAPAFLPVEAVEPSRLAGRSPRVPSVYSLRIPDPLPTLSRGMPAPIGTELAPHARAEMLYRHGRYEEVAATLLALGEESTEEPATVSLMARSLANRGMLTEALIWCDRWIAADKVDAVGHYIRATVLLERGDLGQARQSLQRAVYLNPNFVLPHFALGNLARSNDKPDESDRHFGNACQLLARYQADEQLPESDGLTAGRLIETITTLTARVST
jgi:chemotaxis protein methyltransferase CheR